MLYHLIKGAKSEILSNLLLTSSMYAEGAFICSGLIIDSKHFLEFTLFVQGLRMIKRLF